MAVNPRTLPSYTSKDRVPQVGLIMMAVTVAITLLIILLTSDLSDTFPHLFLLPWVLLIAATIAVPLTVYYYRGTFNIYNPVIYASLSYFIPAFVVGGLLLTTGWSQPYFLNFIKDIEYNLPYTALLVAVGFAAFTIGYMLPIGRMLGKQVESRLPDKDFNVENLIIPGIVLVTLGLFNWLFAFVMGIAGYQSANIVGEFDGVIYLTTLFWIQGTFLLWFIFFRLDGFDTRKVIILGVLFASSVPKAFLAGNRSGFAQIVLIMSLAYLLAGRIPTLKKFLLTGVLLTVTIALGMLYGSTFRTLRGTEARGEIGLYTENIFTTVDQLGDTEFWRNFEVVTFSVSERLDILSSVAVVVSNYEELKPYEEMYGLDNNILKDLGTFFIPRFLWPDKTVASEARQYADLYFDYGENSFAVTPIADLLRNFGHPGVFLGMLLLGIIMRFIYSALIEGKTINSWRVTLYFMLLTAVSFESFYGNIIPNLVKVFFTTLVGLLVVYITARALGHRFTRMPYDGQTL